LRQSAVLTEYDPKPGVAVATLSYEYPSGFQVPRHAHGSDQLIYAISGVMEVSSDRSLWLIPPHFALWIPARIEHGICMPGPVSMRTLYVRRGLARGLAPRCSVLHVAPFLRELIVETARLGKLRLQRRYDAALFDLLIAQLRNTSPAPMFIALPREERSLAVARKVLDDLSASKTLAALCAENGVSVRTVERFFLRDAGIDFESWRRQARLTKAVQLLVSGCSVKEVAYRVGYRQSSALVEIFRQTLGTTPKAWINSLGVGRQVLARRMDRPTVSE
jgi:AraC-like DNA-binding protein